MDTKRIRVFDLHCDTLDRLALGGEFAEPGQDPRIDVPPASLRTNSAHISLDRMQGFDWCQCFAVFIPDELSGVKAWGFYQQVQSYFTSQLRAHADRLMQVHRAADIEAALTSGRCAALLTIEGGSFLQDSLEPISQIARDGVKMLTLTWNAPNAIASGSTSVGGLTPFGKQVVRALEEQRIIVDVSHLNDESFFDVAHVATRPFAASHSNARAICDHPRNLTNEQFHLIAERGGVVGLNYFNEFLTTEKRESTPDDLLRHLDHWLALGGEKTIALGSDYDGADIAAWLTPCDKVAALHALVTQEFGPQVADDLFFNNAQRFFASQ
ncbi:MAG: membrane dipeptidase [Coriobacteriia bacterium]|nr:membrane dipeptidase [Coriobacteriia bacterium]